MTRLSFLVKLLCDYIEYRYMNFGCVTLQHFFVDRVVKQHPP